MNTPAATPRETMRGHLARLADKLTASGLLAELFGDIQEPYLNVALANAPAQHKRVLAQLTDEDLWWFSWPWGQPIGSVDDLELVVDRICLTLRSLAVEP
jgi:hypothetical protein